MMVFSVGLIVCVIIMTFFLWLVKYWAFKAREPRMNMEEIFGPPPPKVDRTKPRKSYADRLREEHKVNPPKPFMEEMEAYMQRAREERDRRIAARKAENFKPGNPGVRPRPRRD